MESSPTITALQSLRVLSFVIVTSAGCAAHPPSGDYGSGPVSRLRDTEIRGVKDPVAEATGMNDPKGVNRIAEMTLEAGAVGGYHLVALDFKSAKQTSWSRFTVLDGFTKGNQVQFGARPESRKGDRKKAFQDFVKKNSLGDGPLEARLVLIKCATGKSIPEQRKIQALENSGSNDVNSMPLFNFDKLAWIDNAGGTPGPCR